MIRRQPVLALAIGVAAASLGLLISRQVGLAVGLMLAVPVIAALGTPPLIGLLLAEAWPLLLLGAGPAGTAVVGCGAGVWVAGLTGFGKGQRSWLNGLYPRSVIAASGAFFVLSLVLSLPLNETGTRRLVIFAVVAFPCLLAGLARPFATYVPWFVASVVPLAGIVLLQGVPANENAISVGAVMAIATLALPSVRLTFAPWIRYLLAVAFLWGLLVAGKSGPVVSFGGGLAFLTLVALRRRVTLRQRRLSPAKKMLLISFLIGAAVFAVNRISEAYAAIPTSGTNTARLRTAAWLDVLHSGGLLGDGVAMFSYSAIGQTYGLIWPHNLVIDTYGATGIVGLALVCFIGGRGLLLAWRKKDMTLTPLVAVVIQGMFSGGVYENWLLWFAFGALNYQGVRGAHSTAAHEFRDTPAMQKQS